METFETALLSLSGQESKSKQYCFLGRTANNIQVFFLSKSISSAYPLQNLEIFFKIRVGYCKLKVVTIPIATVLLDIFSWPG